MDKSFWRDPFSEFILGVVVSTGGMTIGIPLGITLGSYYLLMLAGVPVGVLMMLHGLFRDKLIGK